MKSLHILSVFLAPFALLSVYLLTANPAMAWFSVSWWFLVPVLCRDRKRSFFVGWLRSATRVSIAWSPLGLCWMVYFVDKKYPLWPWDKAMITAFLCLLTAWWQSRYLTVREEWLPKPLLCLSMVALLWIPYHVAKPIWDVWRMNGTVDLMIFHSVAANLASGNGLWVSFYHSSNDFLGAHFAPVLYVLFAGYRWWPDFSFLIGLQALGLVAGAFALYGMTKAGTGNRTFSGALSIVFLLHPMIQGIQYAWFHIVAFAPLALFSFTGAWFRVRGCDSRRGRAERGTVAPLSPRSRISREAETGYGSRCLWVGFFWLLWMGCLTLREDVNVVVACVGLAMAVTCPGDKTGWFLTGFSALWALLVLFWFIPSHNPVGSYGFWDRVAPSAADDVGGVTGLVRLLADRVCRLDKLRYLGHMGIPFAFLWLRGRQWLLPAVPVLAWLAVSNAWLEYSFYPCQYPALPLTAIALATAGAAIRFQQTGHRVRGSDLARWGYVVLIAGFSHHLCLSNARVDQWVSPPVWRHHTSVSANAKELASVLKDLPADATIWCDCSHGFFPANPTRCKSLPLVEFPPEFYPQGVHYMVVRENAPGTPQWAKDLLSVKGGDKWTVEYENPLGTVFRRRF